VLPVSSRLATAYWWYGASAPGYATYGCCAGPIAPRPGLIRPDATGARRVLYIPSPTEEEIPGPDTAPLPDPLVDSVRFTRLLPSDPTVEKIAPDDR
jgi:hypothetical protein